MDLLKLLMTAEEYHKLVVAHGRILYRDERTIKQCIESLNLFDRMHGEDAKRLAKMIDDIADPTTDDRRRKFLEFQLPLLRSNIRNLAKVRHAFACDLGIGDRFPVLDD